ncbi:MAG TPA: polysaccharide deacetylase family protein [Fibrobacteria bacterium]|nr:polysaccharide deacetylase family protein [Fibrobacteria bacterium]
MKKTKFATSMALLVGTTATFAGPVTTVPWNGNTGAVSFTYDDGRPSQLTNLVPQLDNLGIKVTFFLAYGIYNFPGNESQWTAVAKKGHELANHTYDHNTPTSTNVVQMATVLRGMDPSIEAVSFAYPNCTVTNESYVSAEAFIGRGCGSTTYAWGTQPSDWENVQGLIVTSSNISPATTLINSAKSGNSWAVILNHDVETSGSDIYYLTPTDNQTMLNSAITAKVWVAPYGTVGAYYRAHFTMDAVTASGSGPTWNLTWTSPHPKMPKSVMLKVKLDANTFGSSPVVTQGGTAVAANSDGSFTIDFMKLAMTISKTGSTGLLVDGSIPASLRGSEVGDGLVLSGLPVGSYRLEFRTLSGAILSSSTIQSTSAQPITVSSPVHGRSVLVVLSRKGAKDFSAPVWVP